MGSCGCDLLSPLVGCVLDAVQKDSKCVVLLQRGGVCFRHKVGPAYSFCIFLRSLILNSFWYMSLRFLLKVSRGRKIDELSLLWRLNISIIQNNADLESCHLWEQSPLVLDGIVQKKEYASDISL